MINIIVLAISMIVSYQIGRIIERQSWRHALDAAVLEQEKFNATGTPIATELAQEMGIQL